MLISWFSLERMSFARILLGSFVHCIRSLFFLASMALSQHLFVLEVGLAFAFGDVGVGIDNLKLCLCKLQSMQECLLSAK